MRRVLAVLAYAMSATCWPVAVALGAWALVTPRDPRRDSITSAELLAFATFGVALAGLF
jgi:hypothetical protein